MAKKRNFTRITKDHGAGETAETEKSILRSSHAGWMEVPRPRQRRMRARLSSGISCLDQWCGRLPT